MSERRPVGFFSRLGYPNFALARPGGVRLMEIAPMCTEQAVLRPRRASLRRFRALPLTYLLPRLKTPCAPLCGGLA